MKQPLAALIAALVFYAGWTAATWFFEGRIGTLNRPEAVGDRLVYAFGVNLGLGLVGGMALLRRGVRRGALEAQRSGFGPGRRTVRAVAAGAVLGGAAYGLQGAPSTHPVVIANAFAQVFVVSAAEVVVCWALVAGAMEAFFRRWGGGAARMLAAVLASLLFGAYHWAHSAPFNTLPMVVLLSVAGLASSAFFFASRDVAGTVVFHNFLGTFGVLQALAAADALAPLERLQPPLLATAAVTGLVLAGGYALLAREAASGDRIPAVRDPGPDGS